MLVCSAKIVGSLLILWIMLYSKFYSLLDPGSFSGLLLFIIPLLLTDWLVRRADLYSAKQVLWPYPLLYVLLLLGSMMIASIYSNQFLFHAMGGGLWIWSIGVILICSRWKSCYIKHITQIAFWAYMLYAFLHILPAVEKPTLIVVALLKDNVNIINIHLTSLAIFGFYHKKLLTRIVVSGVILFFMLYFDSSAGLGALVVTIFILSRYRRYTVPATIGIALSIILFKFITTTDSFAVRAELFDQGLRQGLSSPLFGIGFGTPIIVSLRDGLALNHPHCSFINFFRTTGVVGLVSYLFLLYAAFQKKHLLTTPAQGVLTFYILWGIVDDFMVWYGTIFFFSLALIPYLQRSPGSSDANS